METAIYNISVNGNDRGRVFLSLMPDLTLRLEIIYPDDTHMSAQAKRPKELVALFQKNMEEKFGKEEVLLQPASNAEMSTFQTRFREIRDEFFKELFPGNR